MTSIHARLPFFYGWVIVAVVFITMGVAVNARTAFSLLFPPILDEFGWDRGTTAGAFSFGFIVSAIMSPSLGRLMDRRGPLVVNELGVVLIGIRTAAGDAGAEAMAALRDTRHAGRRRQRLPGLYRPGIVPAQLVRPPPRAGDEPGVRRRRRRLDHPAAMAAKHDRTLRLAHRMPGAGHRGRWCCCCRSIYWCDDGQRTSVSHPMATAASHVAAAGEQRKRRRCGLGRGGLDARPRRAHAAASGGSPSAISVRCSSGTRCRFTRRNILWRSASVPRSLPGR